jgi:hypothetical protein
MPDGETIARQVRERLSEVEGLLERLTVEAEQLRKLAGAFGAVTDERAPRPRRRTVPATATSSRSSTRRGGKRAQQALKQIAAQPGITVPELAGAMKMKPNYLYRILPALVKDGALVKQGKGYRVAE